MLYCAKCHGVCEDATAKCPNCKSSKLRPVTGDDFVLLHRVDQYTAQRLEPLFQEHGVAYRLEPFDGGRISYLYDSDVLPTDRMVLARWGDYPTAQGLARQLAQYQAAADPQVAFFSFWTLKEAWAKYTGNGLGGFPNYTHFGLSPPAMSGLDTPSILVQHRNAHNHQDKRDGRCDPSDFFHNKTPPLR